MSMEDPTTNEVESAVDPLESMLRKMFGGGLLSFCDPFQKPREPLDNKNGLIVDVATTASSHEEVSGEASFQDSASLGPDAVTVPRSVTVPAMSEEKEAEATTATTMAEEEAEATKCSQEKVPNSARGLEDEKAVSAFGAVAKKEAIGKNESSVFVLNGACVLVLLVSLMAGILSSFSEIKKQHQPSHSEGIHAHLVQQKLIPESLDPTTKKDIMSLPDNEATNLYQPDEEAVEFTTDPTIVRRRSRRIRYLLGPTVEKGNQLVSPWIQKGQHLMAPTLVKGNRALTPWIQKGKHHWKQVIRRLEKLEDVVGEKASHRWKQLIRSLEVSRCKLANIRVTVEEVVAGEVNHNWKDPAKEIKPNKTQLIDDGSAADLEE